MALSRSLRSVALGVVGLALACGREVPATWPEASAASPAAEAAPTAPVTLALDGPPPLPGDGPRWSGLDAASESDATHDHSGHSVVRYVCPMHPDVVAEEAGRCPRCGMALVRSDAPK